jgi:integrase
MRAKLTRDFVNKLQPDPDPRKRLTVWDTLQAGFGILVTPYTERKDGSRGGGVKTYICQYRPGGRGTPTRRVTIGRHGPEWQPDTAREEAASIMRLRRTGVDPFEERKQRARNAVAEQAAASMEREAATRFEFAVFCQEFVDRYAKVQQPRSWKLTRGALSSLDIDFRGRRVDKLERDDIGKAIGRLGRKTPGAARGAHKALLKLFNWANDEQIFQWHPMRGMGPPSQANVRTRVLVSSEIGALWRAGGAVGHPYGTLFQLLLCTGLRLNEVAKLSPKEFLAEEGALLFSPERMKRKPTDNRGSFLLPLSSRAHSLVKTAMEESLKLGGKSADRDRPIFSTDGRKPVSGFTYAKSVLDDRLREDGNALPHWTAHDLRRSAATIMQALGVEPSIIDRLQDHRDKGLTRTALHYQHWDFVDEKREGMARYAEFVTAAIDQPDSPLLKRIDARLAPA